MLEVREIIFSPPKEKPYTKLRDKLIKRTSTSQQKKLSQLLHEERLGDGMPSQNLRKLQRLAAEGQKDELICHTFLERHLANIADNIADLTSHSIIVILNVRTPELADSMDKILGLRKLEVRTTQVEKQLDKRRTSHSQSRG